MRIFRLGYFGINYFRYEIFWNCVILFVIVDCDDFVVFLRKFWFLVILNSMLGRFFFVDMDNDLFFEYVD